MTHAIRVFLASRSITGLFHDGVEDGWWPIRLAWPALRAVSRQPGERYFDYIQRVRVNKTARKVKLADLVDNLTRNGGPPESLRQRYQRAFIDLTAPE